MDAVLGVVEVGLAVVLKAVDPINLSPTMLPQQQPASGSVLFGEHLVAGTPPPLLFMAAEEAEEAEEGAAFPVEAEEEEGVIPSHLAVETVMEVSMEPSALEGRQKEAFLLHLCKVIVEHTILQPLYSIVITTSHPQGVKLAPESFLLLHFPLLLLPGGVHTQSRVKVEPQEGQTLLVMEIIILVS